MKTLLTLFFLFFSSSVFAEDISDFEVEGMSIGESALKYMDEDQIQKQIKKNIIMYNYLKEPEKFGTIIIRSGLTNYSYIQLNLSSIKKEKYISKTSNNENYIIEGINANIVFTIDSNEDLDDCLKKQKEVEKVFSKIFTNYVREEDIGNHPIDSTGRSKVHYIKFEFESGDNAQLQCFDFEEKFRVKNNFSDGLSVVVRKNEISKWLLDR